LLDAASAGRGGVLFVEGEAGLGKSSILEAAHDRARPGLRVGVGRGDAMETSLPFGVLDQALSSLGAPSLLARSASPIGRAEQLYRLVRWLERSEPGVLIALDDLHWADSDSLQMLSLLSKRIGSLPVAIIATMRPWPEEARDVAANLVGAGLANSVRLAPLSREASTTVLAERSDRPVSDAASAQAWELCAGNPLLLEQVASAMSRGAIDASADDRWPKFGTDTLLLSRFAGLSVAALRCARAASVLGVRFSPDVAAEVAGLTDVESDAAIDSIGRSGLIEEVAPGRMRFAHPLFAQALYDDLPSAVRARLHARSFEVLARRGSDAEAAEHALRAGRRDPDVVATLARAGRTALGVGALATAASQLTAAVELAGDRVDPALLLDQGAALLGSGDPIAAARACERVLARTGIDDDVEAVALRMRGRALYAGGYHVRASTCFADAAELMLPDDPLAASETLVDQAMSMHIVLGPAGCLALARRAIDLCAGADDRLRLRAEAAHGYLTVMAGDRAGFEATAVAARAASTNPRPSLADPAWSWGLATIHAHAAKYLEDFDAATRAFRSARAAAERLGAVEALTMSLIGEAEVAARTGQLATALELSDRAGELTELVPLGATHNAVVRFFVLLHLDRARDADDCRRELDALLDERDEGIARIWLLHLEGITHLGLGRPEAAACVYLKAERLTEQLGIGEPCVIPWAGRAAIAHARAGHDTDAARVLDWLDDGATRLPCRYPHVAAAFGRAELAIRNTDYRAAEGHYIDALAIHDTAELPMERISTLLAYGDMLRRTGEPARARPVLAEALNRAETLQAPAHARYAREALSSTGGRRRRGLQSGRLTPQELRVAELARVGNSRREIAQQLTVSEATVRTHLQHIYSKLGIHSLRELMVADAALLVGPEIDGGRVMDEHRVR
jgi:DNA-binding CsgD family transcriptional regulator